MILTATPIECEHGVIVTYHIVSDGDHATDDTPELWGCELCQGDLTPLVEEQP